MQKQTKKQTVVTERKLVRKQPTLADKAAEYANTFLQASAARLAMQKVKAEAKANLQLLLEENDLSSIDGVIHIADQKIPFSAEMKITHSNVIDLDALTKHLTQDQFMQCAKVTLTAAKQVLPQAIIDQCSTSVAGDPNLKITAKGVPSPVVTFQI